MATIDMRNSDEAFDGEDVAFGSSQVWGSTLLVYDPVGSSNHQVRVHGSGFTYAPGGIPTGGTVNEIRIDVGSYDPIKDVIITGLSVPLVDLVPSNDLFWETVLQNNDTIYAFYGGPSTGHSDAFGDGLTFTGSAGATASNDTIDATGTPGQVDLFGDYTSVESATLTAGEDDLLSSGADGQVDAVGDVQVVRANFGDSIVRGGDDVIDIASDSSSLLIGDVYSLRDALTAGLDVLVTGGDDTISYRGSGSPIISGDAHFLLDEVGGGAATVSGGSDDITGGDGGEDIAGDVYSHDGGFVDGGNDFIEAGGGDDDIAGDVLRHSAGTFTGGDDLIDGGLGDDTIDGQTGRDTAQFLSNDIGVTVVLDIGGADGFAECQGSDVLRDIENVFASTEDDTIAGNNERNAIVAFDGNDSLDGLGGADTLYGWDDNDTLHGRAGADSLYGGAGDDTLTGGSGNDTLDGEFGIDRIDYSGASSGVTGRLISGVFTSVDTDTVSDIENITGSRFADDFIGDTLDNDIQGGGGADTITGGAGDDTLDGGAGADWADFSAAANAVTADLALVDPQNTGDGLDRLISVEHLIGSDFDDVLTGSTAGNVLRGRDGLDILTGGRGADRFEFDATTESGNATTTADIVVDFDHGADVIDLRTIDAMAGTAGDQAFAFIGTASFSAEGQVRTFLNGAGTRAFVEVNTAGSAGSEMTIVLNGAPSLDALDFLL